MAELTRLEVIKLIAVTEKVNLAGVDLSGLDLSRLDLTRANLSGADLEGANLEGANIQGTDFKGVDLKGVDLTVAQNYTMKIDERHLRISKIINEYYKQLNRDELTDKDFKLWIESLLEPMRGAFRKQGLDNCRGVLNFQRFILELQDKGLDEYMRENLTEEDNRYWKADK